MVGAGRREGFARAPSPVGVGGLDRGRRIGLKLVNAVVHQAFQDPDVRQIVLGVNTDNTAAICVYEQAGFARLDLDGESAVAAAAGALVMVLPRRI